MVFTAYPQGSRNSRNRITTHGRLRGYEGYGYPHREHFSEVQIFSELMAVVARQQGREERAKGVSSQVDRKTRTEGGVPVSKCDPMQGYSIR